jgi:hypothetical protein
MLDFPRQEIGLPGGPQILCIIFGGGGSFHSTAGDEPHRGCARLGLDPSSPERWVVLTIREENM